MATYFMSSVVFSRGLDFHIYIYVYIRTYVSNTHARVSDLR